MAAAAFAPLLTQPADILDIGCGTGLVGELVKEKARRLDGIDLSQPMLEIALGKRLYTNLHCGDLVQFMATHPGAYDALVSAATLIHFGDLKPIFEASANTS